MSIRLSKACIDLNVGMSTAIEYLTSLGHILPVDPNYMLNDEIKLLLYKRFSRDFEEHANARKKTYERQERILNMQSISIDYNGKSYRENSGLQKENCITQYKFGNRIIGCINNIKDNGIYVTLDSESGFGFMPNNLMPSYYDENGNLTKSKGDKIVVFVYKSDEKGVILCDNYTYEKQLEKQFKEEQKIKSQELGKDFASKYKSGDIFEVEVLKIHNNHVNITLDGIVEGVIAKEEIYWNEINKLSDILFEGEIINAVFIGYENNELQFSLKHLNEKPYDEKLYDLDLPALLNYIGHSENSFIGQVKKYGENTFIENLYSNSVKEKGKLLIDPIYGYNLRAIVGNDYSNIDDSKTIKIRVEKARELQLKRFLKNHAV